jgi:PhzF family phenazine biosynthesis protein
MQIYQVDAFTKEVFRGNPAAIVPLKEWLPDQLMQRIAMENNLAETAFFVPEGPAAAGQPSSTATFPDSHGTPTYLIRWFTPTTEVALCGHATLASAQVLFEWLGHKGDLIRFNTLRSGMLEVSRGRNPEEYTLNFPVGAPQPTDPVPLVFEGLGISPKPLLKGVTDYLVVLDSEDELAALKPDFRRLAGVPCRGVVVTAPGKSTDFVSRCFFPQSGIDEDPVTGSAHTMLVPYWAQRLGKNQLTAIQLSARQGWLDCRLDGDRVYMSGYAKTFLKGEILL